MAEHQFHHYHIEVSNDKVERYARRYIELLSPLDEISEENLAQAIEELDGFSKDEFRQLLLSSSIPNRTADKGVIRDIYRSDLGELLMVLFFEEEIAEKFGENTAFFVPLKNISDRELRDQPGRGLDLIGYREDATQGLILLIGEAKVSEEKNNPPAVVHGGSDSIYRTHAKHKNDTNQLQQKLLRYIKKIRIEDHKQKMLCILARLMTRSELSVVYGCCLVRDISCFCETRDYGYMKDKADEFMPGTVHFVMPVFSLPISQVVDMFSEEVSKLSGTQNV